MSRIGLYGSAKSLSHLGSVTFVRYQPGLLTNLFPLSTLIPSSRLWCGVSFVFSLIGLRYFQYLGQSSLGMIPLTVLSPSYLGFCHLTSGFFLTRSMFRTYHSSTWFPLPMALNNAELWLCLAIYALPLVVRASSSNDRCCISWYLSTQRLEDMRQWRRCEFFFLCFLSSWPPRRPDKRCRGVHGCRSVLFACLATVVSISQNGSRVRWDPRPNESAALEGSSWPGVVDNVGGVAVIVNMARCCWRFGWCVHIVVLMWVNVSVLCLCSTRKHLARLLVWFRCICAGFSDTSGRPSKHKKVGPAEMRPKTQIDPKGYLGVTLHNIGKDSSHKWWDPSPSSSDSSSESSSSSDIRKTPPIWSVWRQTCQTLPDFHIWCGDIMTVATP